MVQCVLLPWVRGWRYDVDPLAEASSILWLDAKIKTPPPKFDVNAVYGHALKAKRRLDPYATRVYAVVLASLPWRRAVSTRRWRTESVVFTQAGPSGQVYSKCIDVEGPVVQRDLPGRGAPDHDARR